MQLESLANELLLELFKYLSTSHIFHGFHGLNLRFNNLILEYFRTCDIDFRSISKYDFDTICRQHLKQMTDQITSLCLSDDDDTPGQIDQFFAHGFTFDQFTNIQSLLFCNIRSEKMMSKIMIDLRNLLNLTHLTFKQCYFPTRENYEQAISFSNSIWCLPKLAYYCIKIDYKYRQLHHFVDRYRRDNSIFIHPTIISSTIEYLSFLGVKSCDIDINHLIAHTPRLRRLSADNCLNIITYNTLPTAISMTTFNLSVKNLRTYSNIVNILQKMPNLRHLKLELGFGFGSLDGRQWEQMISHNLVKLECLQFKMPVSLYGEEQQEEEIDRILDSFRSHFWLVERRWFVQCDWILGKEHATIYTLPYASDNFRFFSSILSKSTSPYDLDQRSYGCVHSLMYKPRSLDMPPSTHIQFFNIQHLSIALPISAHFWSMVSSLDHLISLDVLSDNHDELCQYQLQNLLDRAPRLSSVRISWKTLTSPLIKLIENRNLSVYQLELLCYGGSFDKEQCIMLSSILAHIHCKVLNVVVKNRTSIVDLVNATTHLRALSVQCQNDKFIRCSNSSEDKLCQWLEQQFSSTASNMKISRQDNVIRLWIS